MHKNHFAGKKVSQRIYGNNQEASKTPQQVGELVQRRAFEIYLERMRKNIPGDQVSDWVKAEQEINSTDCTADLER